MSLEKIQLFAPNSLPIVGIRLVDGSISGFEYSYKRDKFENILIYELPKGNIEKILKNNFEMQLVDSDGNNWDASDIEFNNA